MLLKTLQIFENSLRSPCSLFRHFRCQRQPRFSLHSLENSFHCSQPSSVKNGTRVEKRSFADAPTSSAKLFGREHNLCHTQPSLPAFSTASNAKIRSIESRLGPVLRWPETKGNPPKETTLSPNVRERGKTDVVAPSGGYFSEDFSEKISTWEGNCEHNSAKIVENAPITNDLEDENYWECVYV